MKVLDHQTFISITILICFSGLQPSQKAAPSKVWSAGSNKEVVIKEDSLFLLITLNSFLHGPLTRSSTLDKVDS